MIVLGGHSHIRDCRAYVFAPHSARLLIGARRRDVRWSHHGPRERKVYGDGWSVRYSNIHVTNAHFIILAGWLSEHEKYMHQS